MYNCNIKDGGKDMNLYSCKISVFNLMWYNNN